jgi:hypothetical protein
MRRITMYAGLILATMLIWWAPQQALRAHLYYAPQPGAPACTVRMQAFDDQNNLVAEGQDVALEPEVVTELTLTPNLQEAKARQVPEISKSPSELLTVRLFASEACDPEAINPASIEVYELATEKVDLAEQIQIRVARAAVALRR